MNSTSAPKLLKALVVDDEWAVRSLISIALASERFLCDVAATVDEALAYVSNERYHLVVTDLVMPSRNGHSLAVELLAMPDRPVVCVLTGMLEPLIAKDLMARGVDELAFKPVPVQMFAAKMRSLVDRRLRAGLDHTPASSPRPAPGSNGFILRLPRVSLEELNTRVRAIPRIPPVSEAAIEVFKLTTESEASGQQVAAAVQREPALIADVLRLANSSFFNPSIHKITDLDHAVMRLGQKRVGELALSSAAIAAVAQEKVPFFNLANIWRRCLAAGICVEILLEHCPGIEAVGGLFCSAVMQPIGRILLASAFPDIYRQILDHCRAEKKSLAELESYVFPQSTGEVAGTVLSSWGIPDSIHLPLRHSTLPFRALSTVPVSLRRRVELIKTVGFLGELVVSEFDSWDVIDIPSAQLLNRLGINSIDATIRQCRKDLDQLASFATSSSPATPKVPESHAASVVPSVAYTRLHSDSIDFVPYLLAAAENRVNVKGHVPVVELAVINAINAPGERVVGYLKKHAQQSNIILAEPDSAEQFQAHGRVIEFPCAYVQLTDALDSVPKNLPPPSVDSALQQLVAPPVTSVTV